MAVLHEWIGQIGVGVGSLASLLGQWMAIGGQRKIKREEEEAKRQQMRDEFQKNTLMKIQVLSAKYVDLTVQYMRTKSRLGGSEVGVERENRLDTCATLNFEVWKTTRNLAIFRERVKDHQMREKLEVLSQKVGEYVNVKRDVPRDEIEPAMLDLNAAYQDANSYLGTILRALL